MIYSFLSLYKLKGLILKTDDQEDGWHPIAIKASLISNIHKVVNGKLAQKFFIC